MGESGRSRLKEGRHARNGEEGCKEYYVRRLDIHASYENDWNHSDRLSVIEKFENSLSILFIQRERTDFTVAKE